MRRQMMRMAVIYARVSSEQQREENTIASQTAALIEFARSHELEVPKEWVFEDEGYSGATLERPGLERVRDLAAEGQIQVVLAYSPDRLSRKYAYQILLIEEFARHGVETLFVKSPQGNSPEDHLLVQFQGMIAEYERAQILERSRRGKRHRAQAGRSERNERRPVWLPIHLQDGRGARRLPCRRNRGKRGAACVSPVYSRWAEHRGDHAAAQPRRHPAAQGRPLGTLGDLEHIAQSRLLRSCLLRQDSPLCTRANASTAAAWCNYAQQYRRSPTPTRRVD